MFMSNFSAMKTICGDIKVKNIGSYITICMNSIDLNNNIINSLNDYDIVHDSEKTLTKKKFCELVEKGYFLCGVFL